MLQLLLPAASLGFSASRVTLETDVTPWNPATSSWRKVGAVPTTQALTLQVPLTIDGTARDELERTLFAVSDPDSAWYGKHLDSDALKALLAVPTDRAARVRSFFMEAGALKATLSPHGDVFSIVMPAAAVEKALQTTLAVFSHTAKPSVKIVRAAKAYSVPGSIAPDVVMVGELHQFPRISARNLAQEESAEAILVEDDWPTSCGTSCSSKYLTPGTLQARYKIPNFPAAADPKNTMSVAEFQGQFFVESDLEAFSAACGTNVDVAHVIGANTSSAGVEAELDIEYIKARPPPHTPLTPPPHTPASPPPPHRHPLSALHPPAITPPPSLTTSRRSRPACRSPSSTTRRTRCLAGATSSRGCPRRRSSRRPRTATTRRSRPAPRTWRASTRSS